MSTAVAPIGLPPVSAAGFGIDGTDGAADGLRRAVEGILSRRPVVGLAVGLVDREDGAFFRGAGLADIASSKPVTQDTVFRIASLTKLFTAIAVMQLRERGRIDLDAPADDYLSAYRIVPKRPGFRPATIRHLLTHTSGIPEVVHVRDLVHPGWGPFGERPAELSVPAGAPLPSLAEYYGGRLEITAEPGTVFQYSNHGFATLGRIVEDVSRIPVDRYFRERLFGPLGMTATDIVRSDRVAARLATGYAFGGRGPAPVPDREWVCRLGAGGIYSTARDMGRFVEALLGGGANEFGRVLQPATLAMMFEPHYQPDTRLPGRGLGFARRSLGGHRVVGHDGLLPGFAAALLLAPDDGVGVFAFTNGSPGAHEWLDLEMDRLLRRRLRVPAPVVRTDLPNRPEIWSELCGRYRLPAGSDLRGRVAMAGGVDVVVRGGSLTARVRAPVPALLRGWALRPDDAHDPRIFRLDLSALGMDSVRVVFGGDAGSAAGAVFLDLPGQPLTLLKQPNARMRSRRAIAALAAAGAAAAVSRGRRNTNRGPRSRSRRPRE